MRAFAMIAVLLLGLAVQGCSTAMRHEGVPATDLSEIQVGATRAAVESVLGQPVASSSTTTGKVDTYKYDAGRPGENVDPLYGRADVGRMCGGDAQCGMGLIVLRLYAEPLLFLRELILRGEQERELRVTYGPDDRVTKLETEPEKPQPENGGQASATHTSTRLPDADEPPSDL